MMLMRTTVDDDDNDDDDDEYETVISLCDVALRLSYRFNSPGSGGSLPPVEPDIHCKL